MSLATRCPACGTIFRVVQDQLKVSEGWVRCGQCHEVFHGIEALFDLDSDPAVAARRAAARGPAAPPPTRVFAEQRASAPIPIPMPTQAPSAPRAPVPSPSSSIAIPARPTAPAQTSRFGESGPPSQPPASSHGARPGYTGFTPATRPLPPAPARPAPFVTPPAPLAPPPAPLAQTPATATSASATFSPIATRGTIAPRFAARLAEESARAQAAAANPSPSAFTPAAGPKAPAPAPFASSLVMQPELGSWQAQPAPVAAPQPLATPSALDSTPEFEPVAMAAPEPVVAEPATTEVAAPEPAAEPVVVAQAPEPAEVPAVVEPTPEPEPAAAALPAFAPTPLPPPPPAMPDLPPPPSFLIARPSPAPEPVPAIASTPEPAPAPMYIPPSLLARAPVAVPAPAPAIVAEPKPAPAPPPTRAPTPLVTPIAEAAPPAEAPPSAAELASAFAAPTTDASPTALPEPPLAAAPIIVREEATPDVGGSTLPSMLADDAADEARAGPPTLASMLPEDAGEWPPKRGRKKAADADAPESQLVDKTKDPRFLREARSGARWRKPWVRALLGVMALGLIATALGQVAWPQRDALAAHWPATLPAWQWLCDQAGCKIEPPRAIASLALDGSSLTRTDTEHVLLFSADLHNRASHEVRVPSFDVTFMDLNGEIVSRKVLSPEQLGIHQVALPAEGELHVHARLQVGSLAASGFQADLFYP